ncbi:LON peptidase substrate-binding domain-containing protein [Sulfitobacter sp.]|jgi:Lon protease-like protein|uniref:LON peptidase substrate-binding domain-containing protein n=1 Tax=Sulfitobacter sp. TaxID=1903071 RepID=UPI0035636660|tara:strand:- start:5612 stop:6256 length:645 start_codon:yes stop_codon:yes gene_type:complete|eukprot:GHVR01169228.1.p1 GENE.GHVR01169228.1~~GHVR01169228.1.p1  ORF type:complete len:215 (+),score=26.41 GHVR01169228.1:130-774(+)
MIKQSELPDTIAIFPLGGALLLPRSRLPLHIFEPRYLQMIEDSLKTPGRLIGMVQPNVVPGRDGPGLQTIGCAGRITQFSETEDGRYMITLGGVSRFRVVKEIEGFTPYRRCDVNWDGFERDLGKDEDDVAFNREAFLDTLGRYFDARNLSADWETLKEADDELLINSLSMMLDFDSEDKQALLEAPSLSTRRETLLTLIEYALRGGHEGEMMN